MARKPQERDQGDEQRIPGQPAQERKSYPEGMEHERKQPADGDDKPRPPDRDND